MIAPDYLRYPKRRYGMDHDRYDWSMLPDRPAVQWPGGARVALWVTASLQWFPLNQKGVPFKPVGSLQTAYPDLRHYTLRDYGNRVGIYRIMKELRARNIPASVPINAAVAARYPSLAQACVDLGWELMGHGLDMDHVHHTGMSDEAQVIERSLDIVRPLHRCAAGCRRHAASLTTPWTCWHRLASTMCAIGSTTTCLTPSVPVGARWWPCPCVPTSKTRACSLLGTKTKTICANSGSTSSIICTLKARATARASWPCHYTPGPLASLTALVC